MSSIFAVEELYTDEGIKSLVALFSRNDTPITEEQMRIILEDFPSDQLGELVDDAVFTVMKKIIFDEDEEDVLPIDEDGDGGSSEDDPDNDD